MKKLLAVSLVSVLASISVASTLALATKSDPHPSAISRVLNPTDFTYVANKNAKEKDIGMVGMVGYVGDDVDPTTVNNPYVALGGDDPKPTPTT